MTALSRRQTEFQEYLLRREGRPDELVMGTARVDARTRLSIYADAYRLRLLEALDTNYPVLHHWQGDAAFQTLGGAYIDVCPSSHYNIRYFGEQLPRFLAVVEPYCNTPALSEMAALEWALTLAFDAADRPVRTAEDAAAIPPAHWPGMRLTLHPSLGRLDLHWNVPAIWKAIQQKQAPPEPQAGSTPTAWLVWRQKLSPCFRSLSVDEAWALDAVRRGDDFAGLCRNVACSLSLYTGQMCTAPQNIYIPREGIATNEGHKTFAEVGSGIAQAIEKLLGDDARAVEVLGAVVNTGVLQRLEAAPPGREVVLASRAITHPAWPDATVRTPAILALEASDADVYTSECFGPVSYLIATNSTDASIDLFRDTVREHGAMTASVYSTDEKVLDATERAAIDAGVALSMNLTGGVFVNQSAAFSDFHGTGANPAANASFTDGAFVAGRFRIVQSRRHAR